VEQEERGDELRGPGGGGDELTPVANSLALRFQKSRWEHIRLEREGGREGGEGEGRGGVPLEFSHYKYQRTIFSRILLPESTKVEK